MQPQKVIRIAIVGLPNVGKTTFLNKVTGSSLKTANFAGSTTGKHELATLYNGYTVIFTDLPGFNSLINLENKLAEESVKFLKDGNYDIILHIANSEFSYFSSLLDKDLRKLGKKVVTLVNFPSLKFKPADVTKNFEKAILFSAMEKEQVNKVMDLLLEVAEGKAYKRLNLMEDTKFVNSTKISNIIDKLALSKIFGLPFFFGVMFCIFWLSFVFGKVIGDFLAGEFGVLVEITENAAILAPFLKALIKSVLFGVGVLIGFMPTIIICVSLLSVVEQTGYITRVSFLLDKFFEKFGLGGKSLIPLIVGAGCSITAYMSTRFINDPKEKFLTMLIIGFVPCTAKLAVFMLFTVALFGENAAIAMFFIYLGGFLMGLIVAKILGYFIKDTGGVKTKIEIFNYRLPSFKNIVVSGYKRTLDFIKNAATFIAIFSAVLSFFSLIGFVNGGFVILEEGQLAESLVGKLGQFLVPLFSPMDFDYRMIISLVTGLIAKEAAISTLAVLYSSTTDDLTNVISTVIGFKHAVVYLVFVFFYLPCVSATASFHREAKSWKKTGFLVLFTTVLAYSSASFTNLVLNALL